MIAGTTAALVGAVPMNSGFAPDDQLDPPIAPNSGRFGVTLIRFRLGATVGLGPGGVFLVRVEWRLLLGQPASAHRRSTANLGAHDPAAASGTLGGAARSAFIHGLHELRGIHGL